MSERPPRSPTPYRQVITGAEPVEGSPRMWRVSLSYRDRTTGEQMGREAINMHADIYRQWADEQKRGIERLALYDRSADGDGTVLGVHYDIWVKTGKWPEP